jgi:hypothetical protein
MKHHQPVPPRRPAPRLTHRTALAAATLVLATGRLSAAGHTSELPLLKGEKWWGGPVVYALEYPYDEKSNTTHTYHVEDRWGTTNQTQPLLLSNRGRFVWNNTAFRYAFGGGQLKLSDAAEPFATGTAGGTLREAFRAAARRFFPPAGKLPAEILFTAPQYNTWIELVYDQREDRILQYARDLIAAGYPPGVLMIDDNWQEDYGVWEFSPRRFKDPKGMIRELHALGFKVMLWVCPFVSADNPTFRQLQADGCLLRDLTEKEDSIWVAREVRNDAAMIRWWNGISAVLDLSSPKALDWFRGRLQHLVDEYGVDGFKLDAGDSLFYAPTVPGRVYASFAPRTPEQHASDWARVGLDFPLNEYRACWQMAGQPLVQRLRDKAHSWEDLRMLIPGMLAEGLSGYAFACPDLIAGGLASAFADPKKFDPEIVVRSAQVHALMPMMQFSVAPWRVLKPDLARITLDAAKLHVKFGPEIIALARASARTGDPIVRPLEWQWPHQGYDAVKDQFMLGDSVLVAPIVTQAGRSRRVVFPPGRWLGDDGSVVAGPTTREIQVPLERLPYYRLQR